MTRWLRQNTSTNVIVGPFVAYQDGVSQVFPEFVSSSFRVSKNGGPLLPVGNTPTAPFVSGVGLYQWGCSAGVVDTLGTLYFYALPGSAANAAVQVWHEFMVVDGKSYDALFGTGAIRADVNVWNHTSVASITTAGAVPVDVRYVNANSAQGVQPTSDGLMPVDVIKWAHTSVAAITTAGAIPVDQVYRNHSSVGVGEATITGSVNVNSWAGTSVAAITTAGSIPVDIRYVNANSAQGLLRANLITWSGASVAAITTAGLPPVDIRAINAGSAQGVVATTAGLMPCDVVSWQHTTVAAITTAGCVPVDQVYRNHSSVGVGEATITGSVNVNSWAGTSVAAITTAGSIPVDVRYVNANSAQGVRPTSDGLMPVDVIKWAHTSVAAITTAGAIPVDQVYRNHSSVGVGEASITGSVNVNSWAGVSVASITTAGCIPVDQVYRNHSSVGVGEASITGSVNVNMWAGTSVAAITTAGAIPVDQVYRNHSSVGVGEATITGSVNVNSWAGTSVASVVTAGLIPAEVVSYRSGQAPLQPTVAGRTLDVATGGEAGVDWGNVANAGSTNSLSGTTVGIANGAITSSTFSAGAIDAAALASDAVDEILDDTLEGSITVRQALRIILSALAGKLSGAGSNSITIRDIGDTKNRITATVDVSGNRTSISLDGT